MLNWQIVTEKTEKWQQIRDLQGNLSGLKRVVFLAQIAEHDNKDSRQNLSRCWIPTKEFHQNLQEHIVETNTAKNHDKIFHELFPLGRIRLLPNHISAQVKPYWESKEKGKQECCDVRRNDDAAINGYRLFVKNIVIPYEK